MQSRSYDGILIINNPALRQAPKGGQCIEGYLNALLVRFKTALTLANERNLKPIVFGELIGGAIGHSAMSQIIGTLIDQSILWVPSAGELCDGRLSDRSAAHVLEIARVIHIAKSPDDLVVGISTDHGVERRQIILVGERAPWSLASQLEGLAIAQLRPLAAIVSVEGDVDAERTQYLQMTLGADGQTPITHVSSGDHQLTSMSGCVGNFNALGGASVGALSASGQLDLVRVAESDLAIYEPSTVDEFSLDEGYESLFAKSLFATESQPEVKKSNTDRDLMEATLSELGASAEVSEFARVLFSRCMKDLESGWAQ